MKQILIGCISLILCLPAHMKSQELKSYVGPSPTAASLGTYGQIPVSEYSGVPNIQVPLYEISTDGFTLPINLTYHAGALKNSDEAGWVGFGWSLNAGGVITRSKRDLDDFSPNGFYRTTGTRPCGDNVDQEPDMFYYNIGSHSGKFMIQGPTATQTVRYFTRDNIKISFDEYRSIWTLVTGDGIVYTFEKKELINENTTGEVTAAEAYYSAWYVTSIQLLNGKTIRFSYQPYTTRYKTQMNFGTEDFINPGYYPLTVTTNCCQNGWNLVKRVEKSSTTAILTDEVLLSTIEFPNGVIKLNTDSRSDITTTAATASKLDNVQVFSLQGGSEVLIKTFSLNYDYYQCQPGSRLRLRNVTESTPTAISKPYLFNYYNDTLPGKNPGSTTFLGSTGLLSAIVHPTGGSSNFVWETLKFTGTYGLPQAAGARIQKIYDRDKNDSFQLRRYEYVGAKLFGKIQNGYSTIYNANAEVANCCDSGVTNFYGTRTRRYFSDFSSLSETTNGCLFGHDKVITWYGEQGENGKKESTFANTAPADPLYQQGQLPVPVPLDVSAMNGLPIDEWEYKNDNGTFKPVHRILNSYVSSNAVTVAARRFAYDKCDWLYNVTTEWVKLSLNTKFTYDGNGANPIAVSTNYYYDDPGNALPTRELFTDSRSRVIQTNNTYTTQKSGQSGGIYTTMLNKNMINDVIEREKSIGTTKLSKSITTYKDWYNNGKIIKPETVQESKNNLATEVVTRFHAYDESGNVITASKEKGKPVTYIWGYGEAYAVAEIDNMDNEPFVEYSTRNYNQSSVLSITTTNPQNFPSFTTNVAQTYSFTLRLIPTVSGGSEFLGAVQVRLINRNGEVVYNNTLYGNNTYQASVTLPAGTNTYYFSAIVQPPGLTTTSIQLDITSTYQTSSTSYNYSYQSFEELTNGFVADGKTGKKSVKGPYSIAIGKKPGNYIVSWYQKPLAGGAWVYQEQLVTVTTDPYNYVNAGTIDYLIDEVRMYPAHAQMKTFTYEPQIGMTSKCDERGEVTYYEYDGLGRLKAIRDHNNNIVKLFEYNYRNN